MIVNFNSPSASACISIISQKNSVAPAIKSTVNTPVHHQHVPAVASIPLDKEKQQQITTISVMTLQHLVDIKKESLGINENINKLKNGIYDLADQTNTSIEKGTEFLEKVLPSHLLESMNLQEYFDKANDGVDLQRGLLRALDLGLPGVVLIYKSKILNASKQILENINSDYAKKGFSLPKELEEWAVTLTLYSSGIENQLLTYGLSSSSKAISLFEQFFKRFPVYSTDTSKAIIGKLKFVSSGIGVLSSFFGLTTKKEALQDFIEWFQTFKQWQEINQQEQTNRIQEKILQLAPQFETLKPQLMELKKKQLLFRLKQILQESTYSSHPIKYIQLELEKEFPGLTIPDYFKDKSDLLDDFISASHFNDWFNKQSFHPDELLRTYIDHQDTIEKTTKNALVQMVDNKYQIEEKFLRFKLTESRIQTTIKSVSLALTLLAGAFAIATIPFGGGILLSTFSTISAGIGITLTGISYYMTHLYRKSSYGIRFSLNKIQLIFNNLVLNIKKYYLLSYQHQLDRMINQNLKSQNPTLQLHQLDNILQAMEKNQKQIERWSKKVAEIENRLQLNAWSDFSTKAQLSRKTDDLHQVHAFDTLEALTTGLRACTPSLLDRNTQLFFQKYLRIDLEKAQTSQAISKAILTLFAQDDNALSFFIKTQKERMKANLIRSYP